MEMFSFESMQHRMVGSYSQVQGGKLRSGRVKKNIKCVADTRDKAIRCEKKGNYAKSDRQDLNQVQRAE